MQKNPSFFLYSSFLNPLFMMGFPGNITQFSSKQWYSVYYSIVRTILEYSTYYNTVQQLEQKRQLAQKRYIHDIVVLLLLLLLYSSRGSSSTSTSSCCCVSGSSVSGSGVKLTVQAPCYYCMQQWYYCGRYSAWRCQYYQQYQGYQTQWAQQQKQQWW